MPVGWEPDDDGFRGYIFATEDNSTVVLTIKGTSVPIIDGVPTVEKDKLKDNLLLSCCCAGVCRTWSPVCEWLRGAWICVESWVEDGLIEESLFFTSGVVRGSPSASSTFRPWQLTKPLWEKNRIYIITSRPCIQRLEHLGHWSLPWGRACFTPGDHVLVLPSWHLSHQASAWRPSGCIYRLPYATSSLEFISIYAHSHCFFL